jgi:hypothetical protein
MVVKQGCSGPVPIGRALVFSDGVWAYAQQSRVYVERQDSHGRKCKMSSSKKFTCKGTLGQVFICLRPPPLIRHHTIPIYALYTSTQYTFSHGEGGEGGRVESERRLEGQQFTKLGRKYQHDWLHLQSINLINTCRKVPLQVNFFRRRHLLRILYS